PRSNWRGVMSSACHPRLAADRRDPVAARSRPEYGGSVSRPSSGGRDDVLVDSEKVVRIVLCFHRRETRVIVAVGRLNASLNLVIHHEIDVRPFQIERMNRAPVASPQVFNASALFGSLSIAAMTIENCASRVFQAVASFETRWTA